MGQLQRPWCLEQKGKAGQYRALVSVTGEEVQHLMSGTQHKPFRLWQTGWQRENLTPSAHFLAGAVSRGSLLGDPKTDQKVSFREQGLQ